MDTRRRPNFLLIFADQWRSDCLGTLGHPVVETPYLDHLAGEGVLFRHAYSACPSCIAARASLATGMTPSSHGRLGYRDCVPWRYEHTMMRCLRDADYQTMNAGKTHFYPQRVALGFEENRLYDPQTLDGERQSDYHDWLARETGGAVQDTVDVMRSNSWVAAPWIHDERLHPNCWNTDAAVELLERRDPTRPFLLQVGYHRPHPPLDPPLRVYEMYANTPLPPVPVGDWAAGYDVPAHDPDAAVGRIPAVALDRARRAYYAQITHLDQQIGRLLWCLGDMGLLDDTYIVFSADHGELLGDHHTFRKVRALEGSAGVPFIVRPPRGFDDVRGRRHEAPVTHMDVMPTFLDAAGVRIPPSVEGSSLVPLLRGEQVAWREFVHGEHSVCYDDVSCQFVTNGKEKFIWDMLTGDELFFDLREDPGETANRANDPAFAERVALWRDRLVGVLAARPQDGLTNGSRLVPGRSTPAVRPELLEQPQVPNV